MTVLSALKDLPNYLFGIGNNYYYRLNENFINSLCTDISFSERQYRIIENRRAKKLRMFCRILTTATSAYSLFNYCNENISNFQFVSSICMEVLRFSSYLVEIIDRKDLIQLRREKIHSLTYQTLEEICLDTEERWLIDPNDAEDND